MKSRFVFLILIIMIFTQQCSHQIEQTVEWQPQNPIAGNEIKVAFSPKQLIKAESNDLKIFLIYQEYSPEGVKTFKTAMTRKRNVWNTTLTSSPQTYLISLKFEDNLDRVEDNNRKGWNILVRNAESKIQQNTYRTIAKIHAGLDREVTIPDYEKSIAALNEEISLYPSNYDAWFDRWYMALQLRTDRDSQISLIQSQLDSLMNVHETSAELLNLAYQTNRIILNNLGKSITYGRKLSEQFINYSKIDDIKFSLIFLEHPNNFEVITSELTKLLNQNISAELAERIYQYLGMEFQKRRAIHESMKYFAKYLDLKPDDFTANLMLANFYLNTKNYEMAQKVIDKVSRNLTMDKILSNNPWAHPGQRDAEFRLSKCQLLSTQANLDFLQNNFIEAISNRKKVIETGTPFPAYEWEKIGDISAEIGKYDEAKHAYIKALSINSSQLEAMTKLRELYLKDNGIPKDFYNYLQKEIEAALKASAHEAPLFELDDIDGKSHYMKNQQGNVVILTFWDSWSTAFKNELPELNRLIRKYNTNPKVIFWAISVETPYSINKFKNENPFEYHVLMHSGYEIKRMYNIIGFPTHVVIDIEGKIRYTHIGYSPDVATQLQTEIEKLLKETEQTVS